MEPSRRQFLQLTATTALFPGLVSKAVAQAWPAAPVTIIVAAPPGGTADLLGRLIAARLSDRLNQPFSVANRPGASTSIGTQLVVNAKPDGYTLLVVSPGNAINATLQKNLKYDFISDIRPVAGLFRAPNVMILHPSVPAKTVPEFIAYAQANPGKINFASAGIGTSLHVTGELLNMMAGIETVHVPYEGTPQALAAVLRGEAQLMFDNISTSMDHIAAGRVTALAVTTAERSPKLPDLPTVGEFLPGFESSAFFGIGAPKDTPAEIVDLLNGEINAGLADPAIIERLAALSGPPLTGSPADFGTLIAAETDKWAKVIQFADIKTE
jgi:tripartite-type tricarboxylate transporter receptor subunit TctC